MPKRGMVLPSISGSVEARVSLDLAAGANRDDDVEELMVVVVKCWWDWESGGMRIAVGLCRVKC